MIERSPDAYRIPSSTATRWGIGHTVAMGLVALRLDIVSRATLRALLPRGLSYPTRQMQVKRTRTHVGYGPRIANDVTLRFQKALWRMEAAGWIERGETHVFVIDRRELLNFATSVPMPEGFRVDFSHAYETLVAEPAGRLSPSGRHQREAELRALKRLMEEGLGANWSGRGSVRFVPRSSPYLPDEEAGHD